MPKYSDYKVFNHYLYFTSHCIVEAMHVHAGDEELSEESSASAGTDPIGGVRVVELVDPEGCWRHAWEME